MFHLCDPNGSYIVGYVDGHTSEMVVHRGRRDRHIQKDVALFKSDGEAFDALCILVHKAQVDGYVIQESGLSPIPYPESCYHGVLNVEARGVYVTVQSCTPQQFQAGVTRLKAVVDAVAPIAPISQEWGEGRFSITHDGKTVMARLVSEQVWETYPAKLKEQSLKRGYMVPGLLMPSGMGTLGFQTAESVLDVCVRGFLAGMVKAGAKIVVRGDGDWLFDPTRPFLKEHVEKLSWYKAETGLYQLLLDAGLMEFGRPASSQARKTKLLFL